jgi:hypothetical protein
MKPVFEKLETLEIPPDNDSTRAEAPEASHDLIDRDTRRAEELLRNWSRPNGAGARSVSRASAAVTA